MFLALFSYSLYVLITLICMIVFEWSKFMWSKGGITRISLGDFIITAHVLIIQGLLAPIPFLIMFTLILVGLLKLTGHFSKKNAMYPDAMYPDAMYPESRARGRYR